MSVPFNPAQFARARRLLGFSQHSFRSYIDRMTGGLVDLFVLPEINSRDQFGDLLNARGLTGEAVEIGTHRGGFAATFLSRWTGRKLHCIDPYISDMPGGGDRSEDRAAAIARLSYFGERVQLLEMPSTAAAFRFPAGSLDFVYVDGDHRAEAVWQDMAAYWPLLKSGGLLAGHDILNQHSLRWTWAKDVLPTVAKFARLQDLQVRLVPGRYWSWYCWKQ